MSLYLTKISRSYVKGVMRYQGIGPTLPPLGIRCGTKSLGIRRVKAPFHLALKVNSHACDSHSNANFIMTHHFYLKVKFRFYYHLRNSRGLVCRNIHVFFWFFFFNFYHFSTLLAFQPLHSGILKCNILKAQK